MFTMIIIINPEKNKHISDRIGLIKHVTAYALLLLLSFLILSSAVYHNYENGGINR